MRARSLRLAKRRRPAGSLPLLSMVDLLSLLLLASLRSWSADPLPQAGGEPLRLPWSSLEEEARGDLTLDVSARAIYLGGERVASTAAAMRQPDEQIPALRALLQQLQPQRLQLRVEADLPWSLIQRVLWNLEDAGVHEVEWVTARRSSQ